MRPLLIASLVLAAATPAMAGSIETIRTGLEQPTSIERVSCDGCAEISRKKKVVNAIAPLKPGTQRIEIREVDGVKKVFRTEAWLGGSPVVFVSRLPEAREDDPLETLPLRVAEDAPPADLPEKAAMSDDAMQPMPIAIDPNATSALTADMAGTAEAGKGAPMEARFDPQQFELRIK